MSCKKASVVFQEKTHLSSGLVSDGYPLSFLQKKNKTRKQSTKAELMIEFRSTAVLSKVKGLSEQLCHCRRQQGIQALVWPKDTVGVAKQDGIVEFPVDVVNLINKTGGRLQERIAHTQTSAALEHTHTTVILIGTHTASEAIYVQ